MRAARIAHINIRLNTLVTLNKQEGFFYKENFDSIFHNWSFSSRNFASYLCLDFTGAFRY